MVAADLLSQYLLVRFEQDPSRTIVFWSDKWKIAPEELVALLRGSSRLAKRHHRIFRDVSFTRDEYDRAEHRPRRSVPLQLEPLFKSLRACPGCSMVMGTSKWTAHECPPEKRSLLGAPRDSRGMESARIKENALAA